MSRSILVMRFCCPPSRIDELMCALVRAPISVLSWLPNVPIAFCSCSRHPGKEGGVGRGREGQGEGWRRESKGASTRDGKFSCRQGHTPHAALQNPILWSRLIKLIGAETRARGIGSTR